MTWEGEPHLNDLDGPQKLTGLPYFIVRGLVGTPVTNTFSRYVTLSFHGHIFRVLYVYMCMIKNT